MKFVVSTVIIGLFFVGLLEAAMMILSFEHAVIMGLGTIIAFVISDKKDYK